MPPSKAATAATAAAARAAAVDYHKLPRRRLQQLCKKNGIPANKTNLFMARALSELFKEAPAGDENRSAGVAAQAAAGKSSRTGSGVGDSQSSQCTTEENVVSKGGGGGSGGGGGGDTKREADHEDDKNSFCTTSARGGEDKDDAGSGKKSAAVKIEKVDKVDPPSEEIDRGKNLQRSPEDQQAKEVSKVETLAAAGQHCHEPEQVVKIEDEHDQDEVDAKKIDAEDKILVVNDRKTAPDRVEHRILPSDEQGQQEEQLVNAAADEAREESKLTKESEAVPEAERDDPSRADEQDESAAATTMEIEKEAAEIVSSSSPEAMKVDGVDQAPVTVDQAPESVDGVDQADGMTVDELVAQAISADGPLLLPEEDAMKMIQELAGEEAAQIIADEQGGGAFLYKFLDLDFSIARRSIDLSRSDPSTIKKLVMEKVLERARIKREECLAQRRSFEDQIVEEEEVDPCRGDDPAPAATAAATTPSAQIAVACGSKAARIRKKHREQFKTPIKGKSHRKSEADFVKLTSERRQELLRSKRGL